jgi:hypothetical protein
MTEILVVLLCQVAVVGGWTVSRRLRRLELGARPPCFAQVGQLREQIVALRTDQAYDADEQERRIRHVEISAKQIETEVRVLVQRHENLSRALLARMDRLERRTSAHRPARSAGRLVSTPDAGE